MTDISPLTRCITEHHSALYQWFLLHQEALLCRQFDYAKQAWEVFESGLLLHLSLENTYLFSSEQQLLDESKLRWNVNLYQKEHGKIEQLLSKLSKMLVELYVFDGRVQRLALLEVLEKQISFRQVLEHHEEREEMDALTLLSAISCQDTELFIQAIEQWHEKNNDTLGKLKEYFSSH